MFFFFLGFFFLIELVFFVCNDINTGYNESHANDDLRNAANSHTETVGKGIGQKPVNDVCQEAPEYGKTNEDHRNGGELAVFGKHISGIAKKFTDMQDISVFHGVKFFFRERF